MNETPFSLFKDNKYESYNHAGDVASNEFYKLIEPFVEKYAKKGFSIRQLTYIMFSVISVVCAENILIRNMELHKKERKNE